MKIKYSMILIIMLCLPLASSQWVRPTASGSSTSSGVFNWFGAFNVSENITSPVYCIGNDCISSWSGMFDGNNYTSSIGFNYTSAAATLNLQRVGMSNLSATFPFPSYSESHTNATQNNTADWNVDIINMPAGFADGTDNEGENWFPQSIACTNASTWHNCTVTGSGMPDFWFTFSDENTGVYPVSIAITGTATKNYSVLLSNGSYIWATATDIDTFNTTADFRTAVNNSGTYNISINASNVLNAPWLIPFADIDISGHSLTASFLYGLVGGIDMRGDPWYLGGVNLEVADNITASNFFGNLNASYILNAPWLTSYTETDPQVEATTAGMWCQGNGSAVTCNVTSVTATGSGNITGAGTAGWLAAWQNSTHLNRSSIYDDGANVNFTANVNIGNGAPAGSISNVSGNFQINATNKVVINKGLEVLDTANATNFYMGGLLVATQSWTTAQGFLTSIPSTYINTSNTTWPASLGYLTNITMNHSVHCSNIDGETSNLCTLVDTDTDTFNTTAEMRIAVNNSGEYNIQIDYSDILNHPADVDTFNTTSEMILAVNGSTGYFSNMKNDWNNLQNVPVGFADGTDADTDTWNTTAEMRIAVNNSGEYNIQIDYTDILNPPADVDTFNTTQDMRAAVNNSALNASNFYNYSWNNLKDIPAGFADGTDDGSGSGLNGTGYLNYLVRWNSTTSLNASSIYDDGLNVNISANLNIGNGASAGSLSNVSGWLQANVTNGFKIDKGLVVADTANATNFYMGGLLVATQDWVTSQSYITDGNTGWDNSYGFVTNITMNHSVHCSNIDGETSNLCTLTDTNTNAATICAGTTTYLDGEGNCDDISSVYLTAESDPQVESITADKWCVGNSTGTGIVCDEDAPSAAGDGTGGWTNTTTATSTSLNACIGTTGCTNRIHTRETTFSYLPLFERYVASTSGPYGTFFVRAESTTGTGSDGFGPFINMQHESSAGTVYNLASFGAVVDSASNRGALVFNTYDTSETEAFRITHNGNLSMTRGGDIGTAGSVYASAFYDDGVLLTPDTDTFNTTADFRNAVNNSGEYNIQIDYTDILNAPWLTSFAIPSSYYNTSNFSQTNISRWTQAYDWGNHAAQGYLTSIPSTYINSTSTWTGGDLSGTGLAPQVVDSSHLHHAANISSGTFGAGNYTFPAGVVVQNNMSVTGCIVFDTGFKVGSCG